MRLEDDDLVISNNDDSQIHRNSKLQIIDLNLDDTDIQDEKDKSVMEDERSISELLSDKQWMNKIELLKWQTTNNKQSKFELSFDNSIISKSGDKG